MYGRDEVIYSKQRKCGQKMKYFLTALFSFMFYLIVCKVEISLPCFLSHQRKPFAKIVPEIECHTQDTAQAIADSALVGKNFELNPVARPAFCTPTSIDNVRFFAVLIPNNFPAK